MNSVALASSPYAHAGSSVSSIMFQVCLALVPCTAFGIYLFGWPALFLLTITCGSALATEWLCLMALKQSWLRLLDGSALLTGWLVAITLPPWAPWWIGVLGAFFAIAVGKQLYGGLGQNIFNPAMLARTALLITFPLQMTTWIQPVPIGSDAAPTFLESLQITFGGLEAPDGFTGPTALGQAKTALMVQAPINESLSSGFVWWHAFLGLDGGSLGESSELLVLVGALFLLWRGIIQWYIPAALLLTLATLCTVFHLVNPARYADMAFHLASGGVMLGAFFIATDPITSPASRLGKWVFGFGCACVIFVIRTWGSFPEAVAFAVLFMNALTPLIDRYCRPRMYGRFPSGQPLPEPSSLELARGSGKRS